MDNNPQGMPPTQPPQYNGGMPPNPPLPPQPEVTVKPSWQVQAMQKVWSQQGGGSSQSEPLAPIPPNGPMPFPPTSQSYDPYQSAGPMGPPPTNNNHYATASKGGSSKWMVAIIVLTVLVLSGAGALFYLLQPAPPDSNRILSDTLNKALKTSTYQEKLTIKSPEGTVTRTREADLRKLDEPRLHVDNIAATDTEGQIEAIVIGRDYYVKRQVNAQDLSAADSEATKALLNAASDQWVLAINDGAVVNTAAVKALNVATTLQKLRVVVPSPVILGYFSNENQQALNDLISQGGVYAASTIPVEETLGNETVWRQKVKVNQEGVKMINNQTARLLGNEEGSNLNEVLESLIPSDMEFWIRKSDSRLMQVRYALGEATYTLAYEKIDQNVTIDAPELAPQAALTATDKDLQATADKVATVLRTYQTQGNVLPGTAASFKELVEQRVSEDIRNNYAISFQSGTPKKGYIFYQAGYVCTSKSGGFKKVSSPQSFAVVTGLASSLYCTGQGE